mmetsp:Transcript_13515/g.57196  ORF Transcript_13515/g.57196 Transcript_13515/m.57196 type:complete len:217 (+) Transcript_13515:971-1621(+)
MILRTAFPYDSPASRKKKLVLNLKGVEELAVILVVRLDYPVRLPAPLVLPERSHDHDEHPIRVLAHVVGDLHLAHGPAILHLSDALDGVPSVPHERIEIFQRLADEVIVVVHVAAEAEVPGALHVTRLHAELPEYLHAVVCPRLVLVSHRLDLHPHRVLHLLHLVRVQQRARHVLRVPADAQALAPVLFDLGVPAERALLAGWLEPLYGYLQDLLG